MPQSWSTRHSLIHRLQLDDNNQDWEDFIKCYRPFILYILGQMNVDFKDKDDLVQIILVKLHKNAICSILTHPHRHTQSCPP